MLSFKSLLLVNIDINKQDRSETGLCIHDNRALKLASADFLSLEASCFHMANG